MRKTIAVLSVLFLGLTSASAQKHYVQNRWNVFAGYNFIHGGFANIPESPVNLNGGLASLTYYLTKHAGATAEFSGMTGTFPSTSQTLTSSRYMFGPTVRFDLHGGRYELFGHQLFGVTHMTFPGQSEAATPFTEISGGGLDVRISRLISIRPFEMDYFNEQISLDSLNQNNSHTGLKIGAEGFRYTAGAVLHF